VPPKEQEAKISPSTSKRTGSKKYPQVPPKEQEAKNIPTTA
jgi:hypothetical protein